jgi:hypothetical protein
VAPSDSPPFLEDRIRYSPVTPDGGLDDPFAHGRASTLIRAAYITLRRVICERFPQRCSKCATTTRELQMMTRVDAAAPVRRALLISHERCLAELSLCSGAAAPKFDRPKQASARHASCVVSLYSSQQPQRLLHRVHFA